MIIMKFGGSSVKDAGRITQVTTIVRNRLEKKPIIVFSAMGKTTDLLIEAGKKALTGIVTISEISALHESTCQDLSISTEPISELLEELNMLLKGIALLKELSPKTSDYLVSFGERLSVRVIANYWQSIDLPARAYDGWEAGIVTNNTFTEAEILPETYKNIQNVFGNLETQYSFTPVVTGFIGKEPGGAVTTLGRGGSDLTASVLGAALHAQEIQVWKDVDGILTTDPRIVASAKPVPTISFDEAAELAYFGAKVLHPLSIQPAMKHGIPVRVKNSYNPDHPGSVIIEHPVETEQPVKAITCKRSITVVDLVSTRMLGQHGFLARIFSIFDNAGISVDMVATSEVSVSLTLNNADLLPGIQPLLNEIATVNVQKGKSIISLVGTVRRSSEILNGVFSVLFARGIHVQMISQGASKVNIGFIVDDTEVDICLRELHDHFFGSVNEAA